MLVWHGKYPLKTFKIKSKSQYNPDLNDYVEYDVELWGDGKIVCNCIRGYYKKKCRHIQEVKEQLEKEFGSILKAIEHFRKIKKDNYLKKLYANNQ